MEIRRPAPTELDQLIELDRQCFGDDAYNAMTMRQFYDAAGELLVVAAEESGIVGYALAVRGLPPDEAWLMSVVVAESSRLKGIGRSLVEHVLGVCKQMGISRILCTTDPMNHVALPLFTMAGFVEIGKETDYFGPGKDRLLLQMTGDNGRGGPPPRADLARRAKPFLPAGSGAIRQAFIYQTAPNFAFFILTYLTGITIFWNKYRCVVVTRDAIHVLACSKFSGGARPRRRLATLPRRTRFGPVSGRWAELTIVGERCWVHQRFHDQIAAADDDDAADLS